MTQQISEPSFRESVDLMVDRAMSAMNLDEGTAKAIKACNAVLQVQFPVKIRGKIDRVTHEFILRRSPLIIIIRIYVYETGKQYSTHTNKTSTMGYQTQDPRY